MWEALSKAVSVLLLAWVAVMLTKAAGQPAMPGAAVERMGARRRGVTQQAHSTQRQVRRRRSGRRAGGYLAGVEALHPARSLDLDRLRLRLDQAQARPRARGAGSGCRRWEG